MWCSSPCAREKGFTGNCGGTWERYSASWPSRRRVGSKKDTCCPTTCHDDRDSTYYKYAVSQVIGFSKGKSALHLARGYMRRQRETSWGRTSGRAEITYPPWGEMRL